MKPASLLIVFLLTSLLQAQGALKPLSVGGVSLRYPASWHLIDDPAQLRGISDAGEKALDAKIPKTDLGLQFMLLQKTPGTLGNPSLNLATEKLPFKLTSKEYAEVSYANLPKMIPGVKLLAPPRTRKLGSHTYYMLAYQLNAQAGPANVTFYCISNPGTQVGYGFSVFPGEAGLAPFEAILASVKLPGGYVGKP